MKDYKILCLTRHSMRGTITFLNSQEINLPDNITLPNPFIAWNQGLSCQGIDLIQMSIIDDTVKNGCKEIKLGRWNKQWDEVRVDFLNQRTYLTGKIISSKINNCSPKITAVVDKQNPDQSYQYTTQNLDALVYPIAPGDLSSQPPSSPSSINADIMQKNTRNFLNWLNLSLNDQPFEGELPPVFINGKLNSFYELDINVATDLIVMSSKPTPPLNLIFKNKKKYKYQKELVDSAAEWAQYYLYNFFPMQYCVYQSLPVIQYLERMENNSAKILSTHDYNQYVLLRSLSIEPYSKDIPFQSYIIIQSKTDVIIMYVAPRIGKDGIICKNYFVQTTIWKGSIKEWNKKIEKMYSYVDPAYPLYQLKEAFDLLID